MDKEKSISLIRLIIILGIIALSAYLFKQAHDRITSHPNYPRPEQVEDYKEDYEEELEKVNYIIEDQDSLVTFDRLITHLSIDSPSLEESIRSRFMIDSIFYSMDDNYIIPYKALEAKYGKELVATVYKDITRKSELTDRYSYGRRIGKFLSEYPYQFKHRNN